MKHLITIILLGFFWSTTALANSDGNQTAEKLQSVSAWMSHLNFYHPGLDVTLDQTEADINGLMHDLMLLEGSLQGDWTLPDGFLQIACKRPECTGE